MKPENRVRESAKLLFITISVLAALSFTPSVNNDEVSIKRVDLFADLTKKAEPDGDMVFTGESIAANDASQNSSTDSTTKAKKPILTDESGRQIIPIEDFSDNNSAMSYFFNALKNINHINRPVRIAFIGDSFIEGDILTSDLREMLQTRYGGRGVGFVPFAPIAKYRNTLKLDYSNWHSFTLNNLANADKNKMIISGQYFIPEAGAKISMVSTTSKQHSAAYNSAKMLFSTTDSTSVKFNINNSQYISYGIKPKNGLQLFGLEHTDINNISCSFENPNNFVGYGMFLGDETGIYVDNYSLRSSTGLQLISLTNNLLTQLDSLVKYDLVILQYGLNVAEPDKKAYSLYKDKMVAVVNHLRNAMPHTSFLIFSIGDSNKKNEGEMVTPQGIISMVDTQKEIAKESKVAFWNTYQAMGGKNGMTKFVNNSMANKDYTHINYAGGAAIAKLLASSIFSQADSY